MWIIAILFILNAIIRNDETLEHRIMVAGLPINIFDGLILLGLVMALLPISRSDRSVPEKLHPLVPWTLGVFTLAALAGSIGAMLADNYLYQFISTLRNMLCIPAGIMLGYRFIPTLRTAKWATYVCLISSIISAILVLFFVRHTTTTLKYDQTFDMLRSIELGGDIGISALGFALFALSAEYRVLPKWVMLLILSVSVCGWFLLPHRSYWLAGAATAIYAMFFLSSYRPSRKIIWGVGSAFIIVVILTLTVGLISRTSGRDFGSWIQNRFLSLLPGDEGDKGKAWVTRMPGIKRELDLWIHSPLFGQGFGIQTTDSLRTGTDFSAYRHNTWTSALAETGLIGLVAALMVTLGSVVVGRRMVRDEQDWGSVLMGAYCSIVGFTYFVVAFMTMSFNTQRQGMIVGLIFGMCMRARALQLAQRDPNAVAAAAYQSGGYPPQLQPGV
jgi:hypothetical protein